MSVFSNNVITDRGRILLAEVQAGGIFTPTCLAIGSGYLPSGATTRNVTNLVTLVKSLQINKKERTPDGAVIFGGMYSNEDITEPFYFRELGLFAKVVYTDGTESAETLYSYGNAGANAELMAAYTSAAVERQFDLACTVGNDAQINMTIDPGLPVTSANLQKSLESHNSSAEAHADIRLAVTEAKGIAESGFFSTEERTKLAGIQAGATNYQHPATHSLDMITETTDKKVMTAAERTKLAGIAAGATNYQHPATHPADMIVQDATHRFATDTEKANWNSKAAGNHNHTGVYDTAGAAAAVQTALNTHAENAALHVPQTMTEVTLTTAGWTGTPLKQTVNVAGASVSGRGVVMPLPAAGDSYDAWCDAGVKALPLTTNGKLTFQAESKPGKAITVVVEVRDYGSS